MQKLSLRIKESLSLAILTVATFGMIVPQGALALSGSGTEQSPYLISSCADLDDISADGASLAAHYKLTADIDCVETSTQSPNTAEWQGGTVGGTLIPDEYTGVTNNGYSGFDPIGSYDDPFTGTFDGDGYSISNLWIFRKDTQNVGFFAALDRATIKNLTLADSDIVGGSATGGVTGQATDSRISNVTAEDGMTRAYLSYDGGGLVGAMYSNDDPEFPAVITASSVSGGNVHGSGNIIGGLVGYMSGGAITNSVSSANIDGGYSIGGAVGEMNSGSISGVSVGNITVHSDFVEDEIAPGFSKNGDKVGGFVGYMTGGSIIYSSTNATVEGEGDSIGGFAGEIWEHNEETSLTISHSTAGGNVTGNGNALNDSSRVGGFAGSAGGQSVEISDSYATGGVTVGHTVDANTGYAVGGFSGGADCQATFSRSYATGAVNASTSDDVGGFAGMSACEGPGATLDQVYASGYVAGSDNVGGLVGLSSMNQISKSYAAGNVMGENYVGGLVGNFTGPDWTDQYSFRVEESYSSGNVSASGDGAGGLVGYVEGGMFADVYARGNVTGNNRVGGLIGEANDATRIDSAYATGLLSATVLDYLHGMIGDTINVSEQSMFNPSYFDQQANGGVTTDDDDGSLTTATAKNTNQMKTVANVGTYEADAELDSWNFDTVWEFIAGENDDYPLFQWQDDPTGQPLCEAATMTSTTGSIACQMQYDGDISEVEPEEWTITRYRKSGASEWIDIEWVNTSEGRRTFYNLEPDTNYDLSVRVSNNVIDQFLLIEATTLPANSDVDEDGTIDSVENAGPNNGDANDDGLLDSEQAGVTSFVSDASGEYVVLQTSCNDNFNVRVGGEAEEGKDPGYNYPAGLVGFVARGCDVGGVANFSLYFYGQDSSGLVLRKWQNNVYFMVPGATVEQIAIDGQSAAKASYQVTDGSSLDDDGAADGNIVDPVGLASLSVGAPNTGFGGGIL